jgi:hypothetical protein
MGASARVTEAASPRKKRGCLFWAVVTAFVLAVAVGAGSYVAYRYAKHRIVAVYTAPAPIDFTQAPLSPAELGDLDGRLAAFVHALRNKNPVEPLVITGEELTALVARIPDFQKLGGRARFSIADGEVQSDLSVPLEHVGFPGRWFNGSAAFGVTLENGVLVVTLRSASVKGEAIPRWIVGRLADRNLAKDLYERPEIAGLIARLESIDLSNGRIALVPRLRL